MFMYDDVVVERSETVEIVLFSYEDDNLKFDVSFDFVYTFSRDLPVPDDFNLNVVPLGFVK